MQLWTKLLTVILAKITACHGGSTHHQYINVDGVCLCVHPSCVFRITVRVSKYGQSMKGVGRANTIHMSVECVYIPQPSRRNDLPLLCQPVAHMNAFQSSFVPSSISVWNLMMHLPHILLL